MKKKVLIIVLSIGLLLTAIFSNKIEAADATNVTSTNYVVIESNNGIITSNTLSVKHFLFSAPNSGDHSTGSWKWTNIEARKDVTLREFSINSK